MIEQPEDNAPPTFLAGELIGKFHGENAATGPIKNALTLTFGNDRPHLRCPRKGIADPNALGFYRQLLDEFLIDRSLNQVPGGTDAGLSGSDEGAERGIVHRLVNVEIIEYHYGRLATEFECLMGKVARGGSAREPTRFRSASQHQLVDPGVTSQRLAGGSAKAGNDIEDTWRQACLVEYLPHPYRRKRRIFRRLHHCRAARRERRREIARGDQKGMIEGRYICDDPDRAAQGIAEVIAFDGDNRIALCQRQACIVTEQIGRLGKLRPRFTRRASVIQRLEFIELVQMLLERIPQIVYQLGTASLRHCSPRLALKCMAGAGDGRVDVGFVSVDGMSDDFARTWRNNWEPLAFSCPLFLAIDEQAANRLGFRSRQGAGGVRFAHVHLPKRI